MGARDPPLYPEASPDDGQQQATGCREATAHVTNRRLFVPGVSATVEGPAEDPSQRTVATYTLPCTWISSDFVSISMPTVNVPRWFVRGPLPRPEPTDTVMIRRSDGIRQLAELELLLNSEPHHLWWFAIPKNVRVLRSKADLLDPGLRFALERVASLAETVRGRRRTPELTDKMTEVMFDLAAAYNTFKDGGHDDH